MRIVDTLRDREVESMTELADVLEREKSAVKRDLDILFKYDIVEYEEKGRKKAPRLKHAHIFVEPVA
jgi:predicted transcriptional regulator